MSTKKTTINKIKILCVSIAAVSFTSLAYANLFQRFGEINYDNPASLTKVKKFQMIVGTSYIHNRLIFNGDIAQHSGDVSGLTSLNLPFGRIAARINSRTVIGVDVTRPFEAYFEYPAISLASPVTFRSVLNSVDVAPKVGVNITDKLAFGVGFDAQMFEYDFRSFKTFNSSTALFHNSGSDWGVGWNMGALYSFDPSLTVGLSYFSSVAHDMKGTSEFNGTTTNNLYSLTLPSTTSLTINKTLSKNWSSNTTVNYIHWNVYDPLIFQNNAAPTKPIIVFSHDSWRVASVLWYKFNSKLTVGAGGVYDQSPASAEGRTLVIPGQNIYGVTTGLKYQFAPKLSFDFNYTHNFETRAPINNTNAQILGNLFVSGDVYSLRLNYNI